jgi:hypothetical protein
MTTAVAVTNGVGATTGRLSAYDPVASIALTGLAAAFYSVAVTGTLTTADGATALADDATGCVATVKLYPAADHGVST